MTMVDRTDDVRAFLIRRLAEITHQDQGTITDATVFVDFGLKSIDAVLLCGEVEDAFGIELDPATIFEHETLGSFAADICARIAAAE